MRRAPTVLLASLALLGGAALSAQALADGDSLDSNLLGGYIGASVGASHIDQGFLDQGLFEEGIDDFRSFEDSRFGWKVLMGLRPLAWFGAEGEYIDFGDTNLGASPIAGPSGAEFYGAHASATAGAGFAVGYLPLSSALDFFGKIGFARLQTRFSYAGDYPTGCGGSCVTLHQVLVSQDSTDTEFAYGAGAQFHFGAFAARLEYERVNGPLQPGLVSIGIIWAP